ncbi:MAG: hypothetical protein M1818_005921 [Claussenomyces sp. TS43310]|nr:MAG: hypothetical protein M1818_005921 [Claussenomyces sp. TS43310]
MKKYVPSKTSVREHCTSAAAWRLPKQESALAPAHVWTNKDMDPTPPEDQTWTLWTWMAYWATDTINLGTWETASAIINVGLTWRDAIPIMVVGTSCVAVPMVLNGAIGAKFHIPFSVIIRSSWGYYLAYFCIFSRCVLAMFWLGIQSVNGSQCITVMLRALAPSYNNIPNHIPLSQGISTQGMISYFLFWIIQLPLLLIPPTKLRYLFLLKIVAAPIAAVAMMGWCVHKAGGGGALFNQPASVSGSDKAYMWLSCMSSVTGSWATLACNIPDFSRYARTSKGQFIQLPFLPAIFTVCGVLGIVTTSAAHVIYGTYYWNPLDILQEWLPNGSGGRAAAFFAALAWYIAQVGTNITANSISAANDLTVLFPQYVNIRRGCVIAAIIGCWVIVPWKILNSATTFLNFMGGYAVFLAPIAGIMACDFWFVKKQNFDVPALYNPMGRYRYWKGCNWRAALAFLLAVCPNLPGLAQSINTNTRITEGAKHLYTFDWLYGFLCSILVYGFTSYFFPHHASLVDNSIFGHEYLDASDLSDRDVGKAFGNVDPIHPATDIHFDEKA